MKILLTVATVIYIIIHVFSLIERVDEIANSHIASDIGWVNGLEHVGCYIIFGMLLISFWHHKVMVLLSVYFFIVSICYTIRFFTETGPLLVIAICYFCLSVFWLLCYLNILRMTELLENHDAGHNDV